MNIQVVTKNCATFTDCTSEIHKTMLYYLKCRKNAETKNPKIARTKN